MTVREQVVLLVICLVQDLVVFQYEMAMVHHYDDDLLQAVPLVFQFLQCQSRVLAE